MSDLLLQSFLSLVVSLLDWSFLWLPILLVFLLWEVYLQYIRANYIKTNEMILLEIKLPKEVYKSPQAMELVITSLHQPAPGNLIDQYVKGKVQAWSSLEIVSLGGQIHFYIRMARFYRNLVEASIYSQFPEAEVFEAEDYTRNIDFGQPNSPWDFWAIEWLFNEPDPYPIKTYVDYGLDKDPKEEYKIDPLLPLLEFMGGIGPTHQIWVHIMLKAPPKSWKKDVEAELNKLLKRDKEKKEGETKMDWGEFALSSGEREKVKAVEKSLAKLAFSVGIRTAYMARDGTFHPINKVGMLTNFKQFGAQNLNSFKSQFLYSYEYFWEDFMGMRKRYLENKAFLFCRQRAYHYPPCNHKPMVMTTEELATLFHIPGSIAATPTLERIPSKRGEPPTNLPV